tara:strand:- start:142 stop:426 length:285 start_codon:yes stop_codon:yes gene_type:complete
MNRDKKVFKSFLLIMSGAFVFPLVQNLFEEVFNFILMKFYFFQVQYLPFSLYRIDFPYWGSIYMLDDILALVTTVSLVVVPIYIYLKYRLWKEE